MRECRDVVDCVGRIIVLTGMHASGKSTSGRVLNRWGFLYHGEIGWACRQTARIYSRRPVVLHGHDIEWIDEQILRLELARDQFILESRSIPHCIETWHIGNLAYAARRSPNLAGKFEAAFLKQYDILQPTVLLLTTDKPTFLRRCSVLDMGADELYYSSYAIHETTVRFLEKHRVKYLELSNTEGEEELAAKLWKIICPSVDRPR